ncbi:hypothetical protein BBC0122_015820 [Bartonella choladocola]|uniref:Uncharacterized protein n=1 Tax=Bartonella choladocola TaxID=2750995 RepID=A0A1U9MIF6_9HYPH|nr:hypothetical protein BBC0122_015820 [Bartonella choladocola]
MQVFAFTLPVFYRAEIDRTKQSNFKQKELFCRSRWQNLSIYVDDAIPRQRCKEVVGDFHRECEISILAGFGKRAQLTDDIVKQKFVKFDSKK